jgi:hypothetical protein
MTSAQPTLPWWCAAAGLGAPTAEPAPPARPPPAPAASASAYGPGPHAAAQECGPPAFFADPFHNDWPHW